MNNIYIYNNFYELLKLINILIEHNIKPYNIKDETYSPTLFDNIIKLDLTDDKDIINLFNQYVNETDKLLTEYENKYGPIFVDSKANMTCPWAWDNSPWPWENN